MSASSSSSHRLKTPTLSGLHTPNSIPTPHSPLPTFPLRSCEASRYAASALANLAGFPPAAQLIAEGEGRGLSKLVGLLSSGVDEILHPSVHAVAVLTGREDGTLVGGGWYPPADTASKWSKELLDCGILPPLLLLQEKLPDTAPARGLVKVVIDNLHAWWKVNPYNGHLNPNLKPDVLHAE
jgi:hypothetical protein